MLVVLMRHITEAWKVSDALALKGDKLKSNISYEEATNKRHEKREGL